MVISKIFKDLLNDSQLAKVLQVSEWLKINPQWLLAVMYFETAKTFSPSKRNHIGSVGLIQFTRDKSGVNYKTINGKRYILDDLARLSFEQQMNIVHEYYKPYRGKIKSFLDLYLVTFFPVALNKPDDYILQTKRIKASTIARQNPIFDKNKDGLIHRKEITDFFAKWYGSIFDEIEAKKKCTLCGSNL